MPPALKLSLDGFELRDHSLLRRDPPYGEGSALVALPTIVGKAQRIARHTSSDNFTNGRWA